jgi:t-SNARE complex subunit (syntaxin)
VKTDNHNQPSQRYTQEKLSREFKSALTDFQTIQRHAIEKQRASVNAAKAALESEEGGEADGSNVQLQQQQQSQEQLRLASQSEVDFQESLIIEREAEIRNIDRGVQELAEIFNDLSTIVVEQGTQLGNIEDNVYSTRDDTRRANVELNSAARYQRGARNKMCCLLLILAVVTTVIVLAVVLG